MDNSPQVIARRAASFGAAAAEYARYRPDYPLPAIRWLLAPLAEAGSGTAGTGSVTLLDLGAGTGKLTAQLASLEIGGQGRHPRVIAVEPDEEMLAELRRQLPVVSGGIGGSSPLANSSGGIGGSSPLANSSGGIGGSSPLANSAKVTAMPGRAEEIPLPDGSCDAVLAGQSAHWFDLDLALPEIARVLRPGGVLGGLWNADDSEADWVAGLHRASGRRTVVPIGGTDSDDEGMTGWINQAGKDLFLPAEGSEYEHGQLQTADSLIATLRTHSAFLIMEPQEREAALTEVRNYLAATPQTASGEFVLPMRTFALRAVRR